MQGDVSAQDGVIHQSAQISLMQSNFNCMKNLYSIKSAITFSKTKSQSYYNKKNNNKLLRTTTNKSLKLEMKFPELYL